MTPDVIIVLSGGTVAEKDQKTGTTVYRSTMYSEADAFGTLGGIARVEAAVLLAKKYPHAYVITTSQNKLGGKSHACIEADELIARGVPGERIILEEKSVNTKTQICESLVIARTRNFNRVLFVSNEYHIPRVHAFVEYTEEPFPGKVGYQGAESVLIEHNPAFAAEFELLKKSESYQRRLLAEAQGVEAIKNGSYKSALTEDKMER